MRYKNKKDAAIELGHNPHIFYNPISHKNWGQAVREDGMVDMDIAWQLKKAKMKYSDMVKEAPYLLEEIIEMGYSPKFIAKVLDVGVSAVCQRRVGASKVFWLYNHIKGPSETKSTKGEGTSVGWFERTDGPQCD